MCRTCLRLVVVLAASLLVGDARGEQLLFYNFNNASDPAVAVDSSGRGNNGDVIDPAVYTPDRGGRTGLPGDRAMDLGDFNNDAYVDVVPAADGALDSITDNDQLTMALWILGNDDQPREQWAFFAGEGTTRQFGSHIPWGNGNIYFDVAGCCGANTRIEKNEPDRSLYSGQWNHYAFVKDETYTAIYQNGELWHDSGADAKDPIGLITAFFIGAGPEGDRRSYSGKIDDVGLWNTALSAEEIKELAAGAPPVQIGGAGVIGTLTFRGTNSNEVFGPPSTGAGLSQEWYAVGNPGNKAGMDAIFENNVPVAPAFRAENGTSWWTGNTAPIANLVQYPAEVQPPLDATNNENYTVRSTGQILIPESGTYRFTDGVDDYTYLAIDIDNSGVAGDDPAEVLIDDNNWTDPLRAQNGGGGGFAEADITVPAGGRWLAMEFNMGEGGGGDSGIIYWDYNPNAPAGQRLGGGEGFPDDTSMAINAVDAESLFIPDTHLRSTTAVLLSADRSATVVSERALEFDVDGATGQSDQLAVDEPSPSVNYNTTLDVNGITFQIAPKGTIANGAIFDLINADQVVGTPIITSLVPGQVWTWIPATGQIRLGAALQGDHNSNGSLDAGDLDLQAAQMVLNPVPPPAGYDLNADNKVNYNDRLVWLHDLKKTWVGDSDLNGEFTSADFVLAFQAGKYEVAGATATWVQGDWDGNQLFTSADFVAAFADGGYEAGPRPAAVSSVPEPGSIVLALVGLLGLAGLARRR